MASLGLRGTQAVLHTLCALGLRSPHTDPARGVDLDLDLARETCGTLAGAQAFVAPVDVDLAAPLEWLDARRIGELSSCFF